MIISKKEVLDFYSKCYDDQSKASEINKNVNVDMKDFAKDKEISPKAIKAGYQSYKKYKKGNIMEDDDYAEIMMIVEDSFGG